MQSWSTSRTCNDSPWTGFSMDTATWTATIGGGTLLADVMKRLHDTGGRAIAHGTYPQFGLGGHATIGGLGSTSRIWRSALDHVEEVQIVLANSSIIRASEIENPDLFFALKDAGAAEKIHLLCLRIYINTEKDSKPRWPNPRKSPSTSQPRTSITSTVHSDPGSRSC